MIAAVCITVAVAAAIAALILVSKPLLAIACVALAVGLVYG